MNIDDTNTTNTDGVTGDAGVADVTVTGNEITAAPSPEDNIEKHINIAIEAQDGKAEAGDTTTATGQPTGTKPEGNQPAKGGDGTGAGDGANPNTQQQPAGQGQGAAPAGKDLVLKGQGPGNTDLVLKAGVERRLYEQGRLAFDQLRVSQESARTLQDQLRTAQTELETTRNAVQAAQGLPPADLAIAVTLFNDIRTNPVAAVQKLLGELQAAGLTVEGAGATVTPQAIEAIVARQMATLTQQQGPSEADIVQAATQEAGQFFVRHPDAKLHESHIAALLHDNRGADLQTAYFGLREQFIKHGYDWNRPLEEQMLERQGATNTQQTQQAPASANGSAVAMPHGRPNPTSAGTQNADAPAVMHESTSTDDIIKMAMRASGLKIE